MKAKQTWIYCRTAYPDAHALAVQQRTLEAFAEQHSFEVVGITAEHASGLDCIHKRLSEASKAVAAGEVDILLVTDLERLGRVLMETDSYLRWLEDHFVDLVCADGTIPQTSTEILHNLIKHHGIS